MSPSRRSSVSSTSSDSHKTHYYEFIVDKLLRYNSLPLNQLTTQLSALPHNVQNAIGITKFAVRDFLDEYPNVFCVDKTGNVSLCNRRDVECSLQRQRDSSSDSRASSSRVNGALPEKIHNGKGYIIKLFSTFGFIKIMEPIKSTMYFSTLNFPKHERGLIADYNLQVGHKMGFDAIKGPADCEARYKAVNLWCIKDEDYDDDDHSLVQKISNTNKQNKPNQTNPQASRKNTGNYAQQSKAIPKETTSAKGSLVQKQQPDKIHKKVAAETNKKKKDEFLDYEDCSAEGIVEKVFDTHGFLIIKDEMDQHVFFHINKVVDGEKISNLASVLKRGDTVVFEAIESTKPSKGAQWEATKVWLNRSKGSSKKVINTFSQSSKSNKKNKKQQSPIPPLVPDINPSSTSLASHQGQMFYPPEDNIYVKFGPSDCYSAIIDPFSVYVNCELVENVRWSVLDGENVKFDAVRSNKNSDWKATLVWIGKRPEVVETISKESLKSSKESLKSSKESISPPKFNNSPNSQTSEASKTSFLQNSPPLFKNWADYPYSEEEDSYQNDTIVVDKEDYKSQDPDDTEVYESDESDLDDCDNDMNNLNNTSKNAENSISQNEARQYNCNLASEDHGESDYELCPNVNENQLSVSDHRFNDCDEKDAQSVSENEDDMNVAANKPPEKESAKIIFFYNITCVVTRVTRSYVEVKCKELDKSIGFFRADFYLDGTLVSENYTHMSEVLSVDSTVHLNCFQVIDDLGHSWVKPTIIWIGEKPQNVKDMEPQEYIEMQELPVSCPIPTWKTFLKTNQKKTENPSKPLSAKSTETQRPLDESMGLLNNVRSSPSSKGASPPKQQAQDEENANLRAGLPQETSSPILSKIKETFLYFDVNVRKLKKQVRNKEGQKNLEDLQLALFSFNDFLVSTFQRIPESQNGQSGQMKVVNRSVCSQTIVTGKVFSDEIYHDE